MLSGALSLLLVCSYVNVHSEAFENGVIRGQLVNVEPTPAPAPEPTPAPVPKPSPAPVPEPSPAPAPEPTPAPAPAPKSEAATLGKTAGLLVVALAALLL